MWLRKKRVKIWFLLLEGERVGPFTTDELKEHPEFTPFTRVWRKGLIDWVLAGQIPELARLFETKPSQRSPLPKMAPKGYVGELMVAVSEERFFSSLWWMLLALSLFLYAMLRLWLFSKGK